MYEYIRGRVVGRDPAGIVVEAGGIGYRVHVALRTAPALPPGGEAMVWLHPAYRENAISLYGFATPEDRALFRTLLRVKGLGPKGSLAVLSGLSREEFLRAVGSRDVKALIRVKGIGKKKAERILVELGDLLPTLRGGMGEDDGEEPSEPIGGVEGATMALRALGVEAERAQAAVRKAIAEGEADEQDLEKLVRAALRRI